MFEITSRGRHKSTVENGTKVLLRALAFS